MKKKEIINFILSKLSKFWLTRYEYKKIKDPRRIKLINSVTLIEEEKSKIDNFYKINYGKTISHNWHRLYQSYTGNFDEKYFPEFLYIPYFEMIMNPKGFSEVFEDKSITGLLTLNTDIKYPKIYISAVNGIIRDENYNIISLKKETKTSLENKLQEYNKNFLVQECVESHESLKKLHPESINTFRVITYILNDKVYYCPIVLRMGIGKSNLDNVSSGGIFIGVKDDGKLCNTAFTEFQTRYTKHPDSGIVFSEYKIPYMQKIIDGAIKLHSKVPQLGIISWDLTLEKNGEVILIESNLREGSIDMAQMAHGCGIFGENTASILQYLSKKKISKEF